MDIGKVIELAMLKADDDLQKDVEKILNFVKVIEELEIDYEVNEFKEISFLREDKVEEFEDSDLIVDRFPDKVDKYLKIPHILKKE